MSFTSFKMLDNADLETQTKLLMSLFPPRDAPHTLNYARSLHRYYSDIESNRLDYGFVTVPMSLSFMSYMYCFFYDDSFSEEYDSMYKRGEELLKNCCTLKFMAGKYLLDNELVP